MYSQPCPPSPPPSHVFQDSLLQFRGSEPLKPRLVSCFILAFRLLGRKEDGREGGMSLPTTCELCTSQPLGFTGLFAQGSNTKPHNCLLSNKD